jgi:predicted dehydrogenase
MNQDLAIIGFIGAGGIARAHAFAINSLRYFYNDSTPVEFEAVCSTGYDSRVSFAKRFGFKRSPDLKDFTSDKRINTVYILGPNKVHYEHLKAISGMVSLKRVYIEKPVCSGIEEEKAISELILKFPEIKIQTGYQFLFTAAIREALIFWKSGIFGNPVHFDLKYFHGDYLQKEYRDRRVSRLTPAPDGGAMADLGSHALSLVIAFLGNRLRITSALQAGHFEDVIADSDLFSQISLFDDASRAVGTLSASRISSGTGDHLTLEIYAEKGALRFSSGSPDCYEFYLEPSGKWSREIVGSNYKPVSSFPSGHVPSGWLRSMIHANYVFLSGGDNRSFIPDICHGLAVQRLVTLAAEYLQKFRISISSESINGL